MNQQLKERLVGAAILSLLAVLFLPLIFDERIKSLEVGTANIKKSPFNEVRDSGKTDKAIKNIEVPEERVLNHRAQSVREELLSGNQSIWVIQVGSFTAEDNATALRRQIRKAGFSAIIQDSNGKGGAIYRVRIGPFLRRPEAEKSLMQLQSKLGLKDGIILSFSNQNE